MITFSFILLTGFLNQPFTSTLIAAIFGAIIGSLVTKAINRKKEKVQLSLDLHKEYTSPEMHLHRKRADKYLIEFPNLSYEEIGNSLDERVESVFVVLSFFQRLSQCVEYKQVNDELTAELLSEPFYFWYYISYKNNLINLPDWNASEHISKLADWFRGNISYEKHRTLESQMKRKFTERTSRST